MKILVVTSLIMLGYLTPALAHASIDDLMGIIEYVDTKTQKRHTEGITRFGDRKYLITIRPKKGQIIKIAFENLIRLERIPTHSGPYIFSVTTKDGKNYTGATHIGEDKGSYTRMIARGPLSYQARDLRSEKQYQTDLQWPLKAIKLMLIATDSRGKILLAEKRQHYLMSLVKQKIETQKAEQAKREKRRLEMQKFRRQQAQLEKAAANFRKKLAIGDDSHCGLVIEVKRPIAKIQTMTGEKWFKIKQLYPKGGKSCKFFNGQYIE